MNMNELYLIMEDLLMVEYQQKALLSVLNALEAFYNEDEAAEIKYITSSVKWQLEAIQAQTKASINKLDNYTLVAAAKEK